MRILDRYRGFVLDLDGTVYLGEALLEGAAEALAAMDAAGQRRVFLTNKPLEESDVYAAKLTSLGVPTGADQVVSSLDVLADYLGVHHPGARVFCVSEPLVVSTLSAAGFEPVSAHDAEKAQVVVVAFDRTFDYAKLEAAFRAVRTGAVIVATNPDRYCPTPEGGIPDCAAMLAAVEACTGETAEAVVGKPAPEMMEAVLSRLGLDPRDVLMVGDRIETDVLMAARAGVDSALVLTGTTRAEDVEGSGVTPTHVLSGLGDLLLEIERDP